MPKQGKGYRMPKLTPATPAWEATPTTVIPRGGKELESGRWKAQLGSKQLKASKLYDELYYPDQSNPLFDKMLPWKCETHVRDY